MNLRHPYYFSMKTVLNESIFSIVLSCIVGVGLVLLIEYPMLNLEKVFTMRGRKEEKIKY